MPASASAQELDTALEEHWSRIDVLLRTRLSPDTYGRWFAGLRPDRLEGDTLVIAAPNKFHRDFVEDNYSAFLKDVLNDLFGGQRQTLSFVVDLHARAPQTSAASGGGPPREPPSEPTRDGRPNPRYTFDNFVVGESNRFAVAAAEAVAAQPGRNYNPLFLHGNSGLGKTHLLHAIANVIVASRPSARVALVSSERFTNDFIEAIRIGANAMTEFRRKYRECGALLVDDVQFLAGKGKTTEEFFHTFNALHEEQVQIVLSSDRSPKELEGLEERLCSRFEWGMRLQISVPEFETRAAILHKKAEVERIELPPEVAALLATHIRSNVRELEGALMRVAACASLKGEPVSESLARDVLGDVIPPPGYKPSIEKIQEVVAAHFGMSVAKLTSPTREQKVALPRMIAMYLCRAISGETLQLVANKFNKKDHTTVMAAEKRVRERMAADGKTGTDVATLTAELRR